MLENLTRQELDEYTLATGIPIHIFYEQEIRYSSNIAAQIQLYNLPLYLLSSLPKELPDTWITTTRENLYFGGLRIQETGEILLFGPFLLTDCTLKQAKAILARLGQEKRDSMDFRQQLNLIQHIDVPQLRHHVSLLYLLLNHCTAPEISSISFTWEHLVPAQLPVILNDEDQDKNAAQSAYVEDHIVDCVRHGKTDELVSFFNAILLDSSGNEPDNFDLELRRGYIFGANTMLSRVARAEGLDLATVNTISDYYIDQLLHAKNVNELNYLFYQFSTHYTEEVRKLKTLHTNSMIANQVNAYIQSHIYEKLSTTRIADALGFSNSYVCSEFKKATGTTITKHLTACKINEVKYLLERGEYSATEISDMLQFSSVTYFCNTFKKYSGMTPLEWKNKQEAI